MLDNQTIDGLYALRLAGHGRRPGRTGRARPSYQALSFEERLGLLGRPGAHRTRRPPPRAAT